MPHFPSAVVLDREAPSGTGTILDEVIQTSQNEDRIGEFISPNEFKATRC